MTAVEINCRAIYGRPGFAPRVLYSDSPEKLPKNCERIEPL